mmetsp:Transcript_8345/g.30785  ORF Transcript_8345/g.30785 Transcript_8345/m.30785 type:complete len:654 (-) Transcript_8345:25-1986(-)
MQPGTQAQQETAKTFSQLSAAASAPEFVPGGKSSLLASTNAPVFLPQSAQQAPIWEPTQQPAPASNTALAGGASGPGSPTGSPVTLRVSSAPFIPGEQQKSVLVAAKPFIPKASQPAANTSNRSVSSHAPEEPAAQEFSLPNEDDLLADDPEPLQSARMGAPQNMGGARAREAMETRARAARRQRSKFDPRSGHTIEPGRKPLSSRFVADDLYMDMQHKNALLYAQVDPSDETLWAVVPDMIGKYHTLFPLEEIGPSASQEPSQALGVRTTVLKGISSHDGEGYVLYRVDSDYVMPSTEIQSLASRVAERFSFSIGHPNVVALRECTFSNALEETLALFMVYDYYPGAYTLEQAYIPSEVPPHNPATTVPEEEMWTILQQIASLLKLLHASKCYLRLGGLDPSKVLLCGRGRVRVNVIGMLDVILQDAHDKDDVMMEADLVALGTLLVSLACGAFGGYSFEYMKGHYSTELTKITKGLLGSSLEGNTYSIKNTSELCGLLGERAFEEAQALQCANDRLYNELQKEMENGRFLRILAKLGYVNERPMDALGAEWSETGDRYLLKLFRDFVFHQVDENGEPIVDWGHVVECLLKLDAGVPEKILLLSRDERSMLVTSYSELKKIVETSYRDLCSKAAAAQTRVRVAEQQLRLHQL